MKITHIVLALESIKKENDEVIENNKIKIVELEKELKELEQSLTVLNSKEKKLSKIIKIKTSILMKIRFFLLAFELPTILGLLILMIVLSEMFGLCLVLATASCALSFDIVLTYFKDILIDSESKSNFLRDYLNFYKELLTPEKSLKEQLLNIQEDIKTKEESLEKAREEKISRAAVSDELIEENNYIHGSEIGINKLHDYHIEDVSDKLEIVQFINDRIKKLKLS